MNDVKLVSGRVVDPKGNGISGITTSLTGTHTNSCVTGNSGDFELYVTTESYYVIPNHPYYIFTPSSYTLISVSSALNNLNFVRLNRNPVLLATGETGYTADATEPDTGAINQNISFRIKYKDDDNDDPKNSYPLVSIMKDGTTVQTLSLSYQSGAVMSGAIYGGSVAFNKAGEYSYSISANDVYDASQGVVYCGIFQIQSQKPNAPQIDTLEIRDGATVTTGKIHLCWNCDAIGNDDITYTLYLSAPQTAHNGSGYFAPNSNLSAVYVGKEREYTLTSLDKDRTYYWKIRAENQYGAYAESPMYSFSTLGAIKKSFNYPNPFSPPNQHTNFVIDMEEPGSVEITIYSEYGDRMWRQSFNDLPKGQNQISYNGTDDNGKVLYNGTAVAIIKKHYGSREEQDHVRILIIK
jgi:hypothetical protein